VNSEDLFMPQPLYPQPPEGSFIYRPRALLSKRPNHAAGIGLVSAEWAALEEQLILTLTRSLFAFSREGGFAVAKTMLETVESTATRLEIISSVLEVRIPAEDFKFFETKLRPDIRKRAKERNRVVHSNWYVDDRYPDEVIARIDGNYVKYSVKDFSDIAERIIRLNYNMIEFLGRFQRWDGVGPWNSIYAAEPS
jgi:hypothetical protein